MIKTSTFQIQIVCPGCNNYVAVSGITDFDTCQNCGKNVNVRTVLNDKMFGFMDKIKYINGYLSGSIEQMGADGYKLKYSSMQPFCEECLAVIDDNEMLEAINTEKPFTCKACGHSMPSRGADAALKEFHPKAIGVINDSYGFDHAEKNVDKDSMIVFKCMTCGAGLELTSDTKRTIKCNFCDNENYLPDNIWTKLHPNKEVQPLFIMLDLSEDDMRDSVNYFLSVTSLSIYKKHFENFIREYFEKPFITPAFLAWLKAFLTAKNNEEVSFNMDITKIHKYFYDNLKLGLNAHPIELKLTAAEYGYGLPEELQAGLASDGNENVRLALAKNTGLSKDIMKKLQGDSSAAVQNEAKKHKTGFFKGLFWVINKITFILFFLLLCVIYSCKEPHTKANYMPLVTELHQIECEQVKKSGLNFTVNDTNIYTFRGIAFDRIMTKDPNAKLIAHYEDLYQKLAAMEYFMDEDEKSDYRNDVKKEYLIPCK